MGIHAFDIEPEHCHTYRDRPAEDEARLFGVQERWNAPIGHHVADLGEGAHFEAVGHYVMTLHLGGGTARRIGDGQPRNIASRGAVSLQVPGSAGTFASDGRVRYAHLYFKQGLVDEVVEETGYNETIYLDDFFGRMDQSLTGDFSEYAKRIHNIDEPPTSLEMDSRAYLIILNMVRACRNSEARALRHGQHFSTIQRRKLLDLIDDRLGTELRLSEMAEIVGLSPFHFARIFRNDMGHSPIAYVMQRRTEKARDMLLNSDLSFAEIAHRTGFSSQSHMSRRIKLRYGMTPGEMRKII